MSRWPHGETEGDFVARGLRSAREARKNGRYSNAGAVISQLKSKLAAAKRKAGTANRRQVGS